VKALVLSGGKGTRLRPLTYSGAKQLVPLANKPVLFYVLEDIVAAGITDIGLVVGDTADQIQEAVGSGERFGARVTYIRQDSPAGLAHAVKIAREYLGPDRFVMYLGDNFIEAGIREYVQDFAASTACASILLHDVPNPQQFGVAELREGRVVHLEEKPAQPRSRLALVGIYLFDPTIHTAVESIRPSGRGELEITDAISWLVDRGHDVQARVVEGWWIDTGKMEDMLDANRLVLERLGPANEGSVSDDSVLQGTVIIRAGATVTHSRLRGPLIIGENATIEESYIGPFSAIGSGCTIRGSEIEHSIIMENTVIEHVPHRIEDSLIGRDVEIRRGGVQPRTYRLMLGDHSRLEVL